MSSYLTSSVVLYADYIRVWLKYAKVLEIRKPLQLCIVFIADGVFLVFGEL